MAISTLPQPASVQTPQLSTPTTVLVHSLETAFLGAIFAGVLAGYQAFQAGLSPGYVIGAIAAVIFGILCKWAQTSVLSNATAKQNALVAVGDLAQHVPVLAAGMLDVKGIVQRIDGDLSILFQHINNQPHTQAASPDVLSLLSQLAGMVPALQQTLQASAPAQASTPPAPPPNFMLDQMQTQNMPVALSATSQPFPLGQLPFPVQVRHYGDSQVVPTVGTPQASTLPPSTIPTAAIAWQQSQQGQ